MEDDILWMIFLCCIVVMGLTAVLAIRFTDRMDQQERKIEQLEDQINEMKELHTQTDADQETTEEAEIDEATPDEPTEVSIEVRKEFQTEEQTTEAPEPKKIYVGQYELTAYIETGSPCADGVYPLVGWTVASNDPQLWHKKIFIEGYGEYYVHDTGGMSINVIDVFVGSYEEAIQFGRRSADVYIIEEVDENDKG